MLTQHVNLLKVKSRDAHRNLIRVKGELQHLNDLRQIPIPKTICSP